MGGKWTTFRAFAEQVTDQALKFLGQSRCCDTKDLVIGGGQDYPFTDQEHWIAAVAENYQVDPKIVKKLFDRYGTVAKAIIKHMSDPLLSRPSQWGKSGLNDLDYRQCHPSRWTRSRYSARKVCHCGRLPRR